MRFLIERSLTIRVCAGIIDYKASSHEGGRLDEFLDRERERYAAQLERYAVLMGKIDARPIRLGLYFHCWAVGASGHPLQRADEDNGICRVAASALKVLELVGLSSIRRRPAGGFFLSEDRPFFRELGVDLRELLLVFRRSSSAKMAFTGHSGTHRVQSMHSSGR